MNSGSDAYCSLFSLFYKEYDSAHSSEEGISDQRHLFGILTGTQIKITSEVTICLRLALLLCFIRLTSELQQIRIKNKVK